MSNDIEFVNGLYFKPKNEKAPDFVLGSISIKPADLMTWLTSKQGEDWVNIDIKESKAGKVYCAVSTWKPNEQPPAQAAPQQDGFDSDVPF